MGAALGCRSRRSCSASRRSRSRRTILLIAPMLLLFALRRQWRARPGRRARSSRLVVAGLFAWNVAITGEWNYQGGDRKTFYSGDRAAGFPFQTERAHVRQPSGAGRATNRVPLEVLADSRRVPARVPPQPRLLLHRPPHRLRAVLSSRARWRSVLFLCRATAAPHVAVADAGRRARLGGLPAALHAVHLLRRRRTGRQSLLPRRLSGVPVPDAAARAVWRARWSRRRVGALFTAPLISNPFYASFHPGEHTKSGRYRWLPVGADAAQRSAGERRRRRRSRQPLGGTPPVHGLLPRRQRLQPRGRRVLGARRVARRDDAARAGRDWSSATDRRSRGRCRCRAWRCSSRPGRCRTASPIDTGADTPGRRHAGQRSAHRDRRRCRRGCPTSRDPEYPTNYVYRDVDRERVGLHPDVSRPAAATAASSASSCGSCRSTSRATWPPSSSRRRARRSPRAGTW